MQNPLLHGGLDINVLAVYFLIPFKPNKSH